LALHNFPMRIGVRRSFNHSSSHSLTWNSVFGFRSVSFHFIILLAVESSNPTFFKLATKNPVAIQVRPGCNRDVFHQRCRNSGLYRNVILSAVCNSTLSPFGEKCSAVVKSVRLLFQKIRYMLFLFIICFFPFLRLPHIGPPPEEGPGRPKKHPTIFFLPGVCIALCCLRIYITHRCLTASTENVCPLQSDLVYVEMFRIYFY
jgi:hypothetical protein